MAKNGNHWSRTMIETFSYGFYEYAGCAYPDKSSALDAVVKVNDQNPQIHFNFNDHVFSQIDWTQEPPFAIDQLYQQRAKQLRDQYNYLILMYSGGSDSRQVLHSFLDNGIFLDEVVSLHPKKLMEKVPVVADINHNYASLFEFDLTTLPGLRDLHQVSPNTKISIVDSSDDLLDYYKDDNYWSDRTPISRLGNVYWTISTNAGLQHARQASEGRGKVGVIYGCDKPNISVQDNKMFFFFLDTGFAGSQSQRKTNAVNFDAISFFSSADAPLIPVKQCHMIKKLMEKMPLVYKAFAQTHDSGWSPRTREITKHIVYPSWNVNIFQGNKDTHFKFDQLKEFFKYIEPRMGQAQYSRRNSFMSQYNKINGISGEHIFMMHCPGKHYYVGEITPPQIRR